MTHIEKSTFSRWVPLLAAAAIGALLLAGVILSRNQDREALPSPLIGKPAPTFDLPVLHDGSYRISSKELLGEPYLMNVWGSWCPECRVEHPVLTKFAETKRVRVVGYNLKDEREDALRWLEQFGNLYFVVLADYSGDTALDWGIYGAPETFLVDAKGVVRWKHVGTVTQEILDDEVIPLLDRMDAES
ncbi:DsbE family thiol:disulfide interchange protein [Novilysobacter antarcticus]|uniref:DsbE family thiol:disulfide interchange protein n=1 Tax=Novilysobacter antarcticus TaxID=2862543 RepID=UPI001C99686E|nr:DsbE family thiol:disulfide interchange protein [Lysobacter antarcticus]